MIKFDLMLVFIITVMILLVGVGIYYIFHAYNLPTSESSGTKKENNPPPHIVYDSNGIPLVYYGNITGYQRNPVTTSLRLMTISDDFIKTKNLATLEYVKNNANWLIVNAKHYGNYSLLEYTFPFTYNLSPPWHSALAQGFAIQALTKAYKITNNATYLSATIPLLNSFYVDVKDGGITEKTKTSGWWYEEYAGKNGTNPRVLNGMMYDLVALYDYYNYTGNTKAEYLFNQGVLALKNNIGIYDNNGNSYYDSKKTTSPLSYQKVHIDLLGKLYGITEEPIFKIYRDKWELYLELHGNATLQASKPLITNQENVTHLKPEISNVKIAIVKATFTGGAYNNAFYKFYDKYVDAKASMNITKNLNLLTGTIPDHNVGNYETSYVPLMKNKLESALPGANVTVLRDEDIHQGFIFYNNGTNVYNLIILGHQEYVTQEEYNNLKSFVSNGGKIICLDGNIFYAEVHYDANTNSVTLVKGHAWEFDGKVAKKSVIERWFNETKDWVGGNFWFKPVNKDVYFTNNIFNYTHYEETYVNNPNDFIILDYGAYDPTDKIQSQIATYKLSFGKGEVLVLGLYAEKIFDNDTFITFFENLVKNILS